jgi:hypothetical protein
LKAEENRASQERIRDQFKTNPGEGPNREVGEKMQAGVGHTVIATETSLPRECCHSHIYCPYTFAFRDGIRGAPRPSCD